MSLTGVCWSLCNSVTRLDNTRRVFVNKSEWGRVGHVGYSQLVGKEWGAAETDPS